MRKLPVIATLVAVPAAALAIPALAAVREVKVGDNYYVRPSGVPKVTVNRNDTVRWRFQGDRPHTVSVRSGPARFSSATKTSGTYSRRLTRSGTYQIYCKIHGRSDQSMTLVVRRSG